MDPNFAPSVLIWMRDEATNGVTFVWTRLRIGHVRELVGVLLTPAVRTLRHSPDERCAHRPWLLLQHTLLIADAQFCKQESSRFGIRRYEL